MNKLLKSIILLVCLMAGVSYWGYNYINNINSQVLVNHDKFTVKSGDTFQSVVTRLINGKGYSGAPDWRIKLFTKLNSDLANIKKGIYDLSDVNTVGQALHKINNGNVVNSQVLLIPGQTWKMWNASFNANKDNYVNDIQDLTWKQIADKLSVTPIDGDSDFSNPEGYFLPETYHIDYNGNVSQALKLSAKELQTFIDQAWKERDQSIPLKSPYELLIISSLIEKEKGNNDEAPLIASVFYNRLNKGMALQSDPTVIYGLGDKYTGNLSRKDLQTPTPYNSYINKGLPPTPIAMVTKSSIQAAANPAKTEYYYFMAAFGESRHDFSKDYEEHQKRVREYVVKYQKFYKNK